MIEYMLDVVNIKQKGWFYEYKEKNKEEKLKELQEIKRNLKTPVVVMLKKDKETIKKHYIEDGFDNYLLKENLDNEFDIIIKKYI